MNRWGVCFLLISCLASGPAVADEHMDIVNYQLDRTERTFLRTGHYPVSRARPAASVLPAAKKATKRRVFHRFYVSAAWDINHIHYSEWEGLQKLDENIGTQRGMYYVAGYRSPNEINVMDWIVGKPFIEGYYSKPFANKIRYKGALHDNQGNMVGLYNSKQKSTVERMGIKLGGYQDVWGKGQVYGYIDGGKRIWNRGENVGSDYHEKYYWIYKSLH